jgi:membrane protein YqaA with SNARE-associated domain
VVVDVKLYADAQRIKAVFHHFASATLALTIGGASAWAIGEILTRMVGG